MVKMDCREMKVMLSCMAKCPESVMKQNLLADVHQGPCNPGQGTSRINHEYSPDQNETAGVVAIEVGAPVELPGETLRDRECGVYNLRRELRGR